MAKGKSRTGKGTDTPQQPRSLDIAAKGITTAQDFANCMSALMSDLISGAVPPNIGNAACNAGGKLLKAVEMQHKYGTPDPGAGGAKVLKLALQSTLLAPSTPTEQ